MDEEGLLLVELFVLLLTELSEVVPVPVLDPDDPDPDTVPVDPPLAAAIAGIDGDLLSAKTDDEEDDEEEGLSFELLVFGNFVERAVCRLALRALSVSEGLVAGAGACVRITRLPVPETAAIRSDGRTAPRVFMFVFEEDDDDEEEDEDEEALEEDTTPMEGSGALDPDGTRLCEADDVADGGLEVDIDGNVVKEDVDLSLGFR